MIFGMRICERLLHRKKGLELSGAADFTVKKYAFKQKSTFSFQGNQPKLAHEFNFEVDGLSAL
jgi:hypothetical protein